ncbi:MAG: hypothetical protein HYY76_15450 [Acidobacteria bacterium]|nr:hypothetical protein [Acidobacteriota bacterium]
MPRVIVALATLSVLMFGSASASAQSWRTGFSKLGIGATEWLVRQNPMIVGSDTCCVEVNPNPDPNLRSPVHQILLAVHGIYMIESLKLDELVERGIHEFAFIVQPLKLRGATGSSVAPVAVR